MREMNIMLIIPAIYLVIEMILGYRRGLIKSVVLLFSWIVSLGGSGLLVREFIKRSDKVSEFTSYFKPLVGDQLSKMAAFATLFIILMIMIKVFFHIIMKLSGIISDIPVVGTVNRLLGAVFGFLKGGILIFVVFLIYSIYNGMYLDMLWEEVPQFMHWIELAKGYLEQIWIHIQ